MTISGLRLQEETGVNPSGRPSRLLTWTKTALRDVTIVAVGTPALVIVLSFWINDAWPYVLPEIDLENPVPRFPVMRVALVTAILIVASPYVTRPSAASAGWRWSPQPSPLSASAMQLRRTRLARWESGCSLRGSCSRCWLAARHGGAALAHLGVPNRGIQAAPYQTWGVVRFVATGNDGEIVEVKVHGRDAFDSQVAAKVWHTLWYRETGPAVSYTRLQAVEHEALMTVMAKSAGVNVPRLAAVGAASSEISLISFRDSGVALPDVDPEGLADDQLVGAWSQVRLLHVTP